MTRFVPYLDPATLSNFGERTVATALAQLNLPEWVSVYHGYLYLERLTFAPGHDFSREGEIDFVIFDRRRGILILEVKGNAINFSPAHGYSWAGDGTPIKSPFEQARKNRHSLEMLILDQPEYHGRSEVPFVFGYGVSFPRCNWSGSLPADVHPPMIIGFDDLPKLGERLDQLFDYWSRPDIKWTPDERSIRGVEGALQAAMRLIPVIAADVADQEESLRRATDEQARVLELMSAVPRVAFNGVAGSGKTLLALNRAKEFARDGKRTLLVCYNKPLADWMNRWAGKNLPSALRPNVWIGTFHSLCVETCKKADVELKVRPGDGDFWLYEAPDKLETAAGKLTSDERYDAVVVDEGQDFPSIWFTALRLLGKTQDDASPLYWFYDPRQNLYLTADQSALPANLQGPITLKRNCRNTRRISERCGKIVNEAFLPFDDTPEGDDVREVSEASLKDVIKTVRDQVLRWTDQGGRLKPNQIAILTPQEPGKQWPEKIGTIPLDNDFDRWRRGECILLSSHRRFKGLEADALILADIPKAGVGTHFTTADFYVACSRAKHHLTIVSHEGA